MNVEWNGKGRGMGKKEGKGEGKGGEGKDINTILQTHARLS